MDAYVRAFGADSHDAFYTNEVRLAALKHIKLKQLDNSDNHRRF
jgi:hypothetical protein